jgi:hypothetical protein
MLLLLLACQPLSRTYYVERLREQPRIEPDQQVSMVNATLAMRRVSLYGVRGHIASTDATPFEDNDLFQNA